MRAAAANPADEVLLIEDGLSPIDDSAEALGWVERMAEHNEGDTDATSDDDPAVSVRLSTDELDWLAGFLTSEQAPDTSMNLEMFDGYFSALVIGPTTVMPSEYLPEIWGEDSDAVIYDSAEQAEYVMGLLMLRSNSIAPALWTCV